MKVFNVKINFKTFRGYHMKYSVYVYYVCTACELFTSTHEYLHTRKHKKKK